MTHNYGAVTAVSDLSLDVAPGEIVALLGRSGCGKTTLLRIAAGIERQSAGRVLLDGRAVADGGLFEPPETRGIGFVFQDYALFPHLSVADNVAFGLRNLPRAQAKAVALKALGRVGLAHHAGDYPHELSGGEQQRVALARAIAPRPGVLLMDEPFSGLDRRLRDSVREETLAVLHETQATSLLVTHDPEEAMRMADRIALMHLGSLIQIGTPEELYLRPKSLFAARFFSEINELEGVVKAGSVETALGVASANGHADGRGRGGPSAVRDPARSERFGAAGPGHRLALSRRHRSSRNCGRGVGYAGPGACGGGALAGRNRCRRRLRCRAGACVSGGRNLVSALTDFAAGFPVRFEFSRKLS